MQPDTGGRFSLRLCEDDASRARYALTVATAGAEWTATAVVTIADGGIEFGAWQGEGTPPRWLVQYARAALRSTWRAHADQGWPRRLTRWRDAPSRAEPPSSEN
jgi:hypothetical protein